MLRGLRTVVRRLAGSYGGASDSRLGGGGRGDGAGATRPVTRRLLRDSQRVRLGSRVHTKVGKTQKTRRGEEEDRERREQVEEASASHALIVAIAAADDASTAAP